MKSYLITQIIEQNNKPGYRVFLPTYKSWYESHTNSYKDVDFRSVDKRLHGWTDVAVECNDKSWKYYKFIEIHKEPIYYGWLKKWANLESNHFIVLYTLNSNFLSSKYSIYRCNEFALMSDMFHDYTSINNLEAFVPNMITEDKLISLKVNPRSNYKETVKAIGNIMLYAIDNKHEYLLHKSAGFTYEYKGYTYHSLSEVYNSTVYLCKYNTFNSFRSAFQRGKIVDVQKVKKLPVSYLDEVESNNEAKEVSLLRKAPRQPKGFRSESREQELSGCPKAESSFPVLDLKQKESVNHKSKEQETKPENEPKSNARRGHDRDDADAFNHLRVLIEEERKNKVITPINVYKCKRA